MKAIHDPKKDNKSVTSYKESTYRMIAAGWEIYSGKCPPPKSMNDYEFNIMDGIVFKKLKK